VIAGCDVGSPATQPVDTAPLGLLDIRATTDLDDDFQPIRTSLAWDGSSRVLTTASFVLKFDRFLLPGSVIRQSVCLRADLGEVQTYTQCSGGIQLEPMYDPLARTVIYRRAADQPRLALDTKYRLTVLPPAEGTGAAGFRAFDGAPLQGRLQIDFTTVAQDPPQATDELPPGGDLFCRRDPECLAGCGTDVTCQRTCTAGTAVVWFMNTCTQGANCHSQGAAGPAMGLDLSSPEAIQATAVDVVAHQAQLGEHANDPDENPPRFGRAMPLIDPGNPGNSYLLYKIAVGLNAVDPSLSAEAAAAMSEEIARLRASVVVAMPMPPQAAPSFVLFPQDPEPRVAAEYIVPDVDGINLLTAWIAAGAMTHDCTKPPFN
jgi:hypothetical protein